MQHTLWLITSKLHDQRCVLAVLTTEDLQLKLLHHHFINRKLGI